MPEVVKRLQVHRGPKGLFHPHSTPMGRAFLVSPTLLEKDEFVARYGSLNPPL